MTAREKALADAAAPMVRWFDRYWSAHLDCENRAHWSEELRGMVDARHALDAALALPVEPSLPPICEYCGNNATVTNYCDACGRKIPAAVPPTPTPRCACTYHDTGGSPDRPCSSEAAEDFLPTPDGAAVGFKARIAIEADDVPELIRKVLTEMETEHANIRAEVERLTAEVQMRDELAQIAREHYGDLLFHDDTDTSYHGEDCSPHDVLVCCVNTLGTMELEVERLTRERDEARGDRQAAWSESMRLRLEIKALRDATGEDER